MLSNVNSNNTHDSLYDVGKLLLIKNTFAIVFLNLGYLMNSQEEDDNK